MIRKWLHAGARSFGKKYNYDVGYMHEVIKASSRAGLALTFLPMVTGYKGPPEARDVWAGALLASTLDGDCGPCGQLIITFALEAGVQGDLLLAAVEGRFDDAQDVGLGFQFARHAISTSYEPNTFGEIIHSRFGEQALVAASFAAASGRFYPVFKRGLGEGHACQAININGRIGKVAV
ncbi:hypothetical protein NBRC116594_17570 [Shimia sp. NS0008-38b]|uniref:hypothetical protein n=1 Tax=Shimia sp. NS0008-38b TaxID=3127653 RepID=UPI003106C89A